jgi:hypothetical protein
MWCWRSFIVIIIGICFTLKPSSWSLRSTFVAIASFIILFLFWIITTTTLYTLLSRIWPLISCSTANSWLSPNSIGYWWSFLTITTAWVLSRTPTWWVQTIRPCWLFRCWVGGCITSRTRWLSISNISQWNWWVISYIFV